MPRVQTEKNSWFYRRVVIFATLVFCAVALAYLTAWAPSDPLREHLAFGFITLVGTVVSGYVFGAVWDDNNLNKLQKDPDADQ